MYLFASHVICAELGLELGHRVGSKPDADGRPLASQSILPRPLRSI